MRHEEGDEEVSVKDCILLAPGNRKKGPSIYIESKFSMRKSWRWWVEHFHHVIKVLNVSTFQEKWWCHWSGSIDLSIPTLAGRKKIVPMKCLQVSTGTTPLLPALRRNVSSWHLINTAGKERFKFWQMFWKLSIVQNHYLS